MTCECAVKENNSQLKVQKYSCKTKLENIYYDLQSSVTKTLLTLKVTYKDTLSLHQTTLLFYLPLESPPTSISLLLERDMNIKH